MSGQQPAQNADYGPLNLDASGSAPPPATPWDPSWTINSVLSTLPGHPKSSAPSSPLPFFHLLERLKSTPREGWRRFGVAHGESISDHMYRMSIITMLAPPSLTKHLNIPHCTKMALVHDMAESIVGDITPAEKIPKPEKARRESEAMDYLCDTLLGAWGGGTQGKDIKAIFDEYEKVKTPESVFVHDVDKVELLLQMVEYERQAKEPLDLGEFSQVAERIELEEMKIWARQILGERREWWKAMGKTPKYIDLVDKI